jgi:hypothetical protein
VRATAFVTAGPYVTTIAGASHLDVPNLDRPDLDGSR